MIAIPVELKKLKVEDEFSKFSHIRIGSTLPYFFAPQNYNQLRNIILWATKNNLEVLPIGGCSNILMGKAHNTAVISDQNLPRKLEFRTDSAICSGNLNINYILMQAAKQYLSGLEFLAGIPANLGGVIKMNAGADNQNISNILQKITVMNLAGKIVEYDVSELEFDYRNCKIEGFILAASLKLSAHTDSYKKIKKYLQKRKASQPLKSNNLGCFFKNPTFASAGQLIDKAGLKGFSYKNMQVSKLHANFLINNGSANFQQATQLIKMVKQKVKEKFSVNLELEVKVIE